MFIKFLKYLHHHAETIAKKEFINKFDIDSIKRDLEKLKNELKNSNETGIEEIITESVMALKLSINGAFLEGRKKNFWHTILELVFWNSPVFMTLKKKNSEIIAKGLINFRNKISHILFALSI